MQKNLESFNKNKYCLVDSALDRKHCESLESYSLISREASPNNGDDQVPNSYSKYADPLMEKLLIDMIPIIEENTGKKVFPTYSYYRIYKNGDELKTHKDRESCEISASLCIGYNYDDSEGSWPIKIDDQSFSMEPGDMIIYRGIEVPHGRDAFNADDDAYHIQAFLHYVDADGEYKEWKFDKR